MEHVGALQRVFINSSSQEAWITEDVCPNQLRQSDMPYSGSYNDLKIECFQSLTGIISRNLWNWCKSSEGAELLALYGAETNSLNPRLTFVPHIVINDHHVKYHEVRWNLKSLVCSQYQGTDTEACP